MPKILYYINNMTDNSLTKAGIIAIRVAVPEGDGDFHVECCFTKEKLASKREFALYAHSCGRRILEERRRCA